MATAKERKPLVKMTVEELEEVSRREEALLGNRALVSKLPDGGQKLRATLEEVRKLLAERGREGGQSQSLARGQLNDVLAAIEWRAKPEIGEEERNGDSDDDDDDEGTVSNQENAEKTLKMLASVACPPARKTRTVPPDSPGSGDLAGLAAFLKTVRIDDAARTATPSRRPKFVPNALPPEKRKPSRQPVPVRKVEMMSLAESVAVHREAEARARRDEARFAASRLAIVSVSAPSTTARVGSLAASSVEGAASAGVGAGPSFSGYRERKDESESDGESCSREEEVDDDDDDDDDGS